MGVMGVRACVLISFDFILLVFLVLLLPPPNYPIYRYDMAPFRGHKRMRARRAPVSRGPLRGPIALYSPPGVKGGPMVGLGWPGLVEFDVDRPRSRATDGHSVVNATCKTKNHADARHKRSYIRPNEGQNDHDRALWAWA